MTFRRDIQFAIATAVLTVVGVRELAASDASTSDLCVSAARTAARESGVPIEILLAVTLTETGRGRPDGAHFPWPWSLNHGGKSLWFASRDEALTYLEAVVSAGERNVDVGCFQLNVRWHAKAFSSADDMIDPERNALYAAGFLASHHRRTGDWIAAVAAYHSTDPDLAAIYLDRFRPHFDGVSATSAPSLAEVRPDASRTEDASKINTYPLLRAGLASGAGSLVPLLSDPHPLFGQ